MRNPPLEELLSWPTPNYINPVTKGNSLEVVGITLMVISILLVLARMYCRHFVLHTIGIDDYLVAFSLLPMCALTILTIKGAHLGWGHHIWDVSPEQEVPLLLYSWTSQLLFVIAVSVSKLSIVWSYARLSPSKLFRYILIASALFIIFYGISFSATVIFRCSPINAYWSSDTEFVYAACIGENIPLITSSAINIFTDVWLTILPIPVLWKLTLPRRQRVILIILMSLGIFVCATGVIRIVYLTKMLLYTYDVTWEGYAVWLWTLLEIQLGIIATSIPPLRPLIRLYFPNILGKGSVISKAGLSVRTNSLHIPGFQMVTAGDAAAHVHPHNSYRKSNPAPYGSDEGSLHSASTERLQDRERDLQRQAQTGKGYTSPV